MIEVIINLLEMPNKLASSTGDALAGQEQAPRATNTIHWLEREPSALGDEEQIGELSNAVWRLKLSWICKGSNGEA